jgi:uncharacterized protein (TIGR03067 family)
MCRGLSAEAERPTKFAAPADSGLIYVVMKRMTEKTAGSDAHNTKESTRTAAAEAELKRFEGNWSYVSVIANGDPAPEESVKNSRLEISGDKFTVKGSQTYHRGTFVVDPTVKPKTLDVTFSEGEQEGKTIKGIYELEGDRCKVCIALGDQPRPTEFASPAGSGYALEELKRIKP